MIVVDASVVVGALGDLGARGTAARQALRQEDLSAPTHLDLEVCQGLRRNWLARKLTESQFTDGVQELRSLPVARFPVFGLMARVFELRHNMTPYDAAYVALAERLGVELVTLDGRLANSTGARCPIRLLAIDP